LNHYFGSFSSSIIDIKSLLVSCSPPGRRAAVDAAQNNMSPNYLYMNFI
jgi:hypothetical protein